MKGLSAKIVKTLTIGSTLLCNDNSGAKELRIIGVVGWKGRRGRNPRAGVADMVICSVRKGDPKMVGTVVRAVITRQKKEIRRPNGMRVFFEDNAGVLVNEDGLPTATEIKGVVAREIGERFPKVIAIAPGVA